MWFLHCLSSFTFVCAVGCCCLLVCVCDLVLGESSGTCLFYHFRQALPVTDDIVLPFFPSLGRNDRDQDGGGVLIGIQKQLENIVTVVEKQHAVEENLWLVIDNNQVAIRVGVIYAPQESRTAKEAYEEMYQNIERQIVIAKQEKQKLLMMGDFNCKVGKVIKGNNAEVSKSGKIFNQMITRNKLLVLNSLESCKGIWTREEGGTRSVLDYIIVDQKDGSTV